MLYLCFCCGAKCAAFSKVHTVHKVWQEENIPYNHQLRHEVAILHTRAVAITTILQYRTIDKPTTGLQTTAMITSHRVMFSLFFFLTVTAAALVTKPKVTPPVLDEAICKTSCSAEERVSGAAQQQTHVQLTLVSRCKNAWMKFKVCENVIWQYKVKGQQ